MSHRLKSFRRSCLLGIALLLAVSGLPGRSFTQEKRPETAIGIAIHGGAGTILKSDLTPELEQAYIAKLTEALTAGYDIL